MIHNRCDKDRCTGCGACAKICPMNCIEMIQGDILGTIYPKVNTEKCVECGLCVNTCHAIKEVDIVKFRFPQKCFAARSCSDQVTEFSASGGIASSLYSYMIDHDGYAEGTFFDRKEGVVFKEVKNLKDLERARNSKYVFSDLNDSFERYEQNLKTGRKCLFIGLPCQVAAMKCYLAATKVAVDDLMTVEIICHGVPNYRLLCEHLNYIEKRVGKTIEKIAFRGPRSLYNFSCFADEKVVWKKGIKEDDTYYKGFSEDIIFRENCYNCNYAQNKRIADITIGDYSGLGKDDPVDFDTKQMSVVLCNTDKGVAFFNDVCNKENIEKHERKVMEPMNAVGNPQLRHPVNRPAKRDEFIKLYTETKDFELSVRKTLKKQFAEYYLHLPIMKLKRIIKEFIKK